MAGNLVQVGSVNAGIRVATDNGIRISGVSDPCCCPPCVLVKLDVTMSFSGISSRGCYPNIFPRTTSYDTPPNRTYSTTTNDPVSGGGGSTVCSVSTPSGAIETGVIIGKNYALDPCSTPTTNITASLENYIVISQWTDGDFNVQVFWAYGGGLLGVFNSGTVIVAGPSIPSSFVLNNIYLIAPISQIYYDGTCTVTLAPH